MELYVQPLTHTAFASYGDVIETENRDFFHINQGKSKRYHDLANIEILQQNQALLSIVRAEPMPMPIIINLLEKHPLGSQAFIPMNRERFVVIVARGEEKPDLTTLKAFITNGRQGINYHRNVWHCPLFALQEITDFLTIDRGGDNNCDLYTIPHHQLNL